MVAQTRHIRAIPEPTFFEVDPPLTYSEYMRYRNQKYQVEVNEDPPDLTSLKVLGVWPGSIDYKSLDVPASHRAVPSLMRQTGVGRGIRDGQLSLRCSELLAGGIGHFAQVWKGALFIPGKESETGVPVAIKFYRDSFWDNDCWGTFQDLGAGEHQIPVYQQAQTEAWAYFRMQRMQGKEIPWSYAFIKLGMDDFGADEEPEVIVHIMELITTDGRVSKQLASIQEEISDTPEDAAVRIFYADRILDSIHKITSCGVIPRDTNARNILMYSPSTIENTTSNGPLQREVFELVWIDFCETYYTECPEELGMECELNPRNDCFRIQPMMSVVVKCLIWPLKIKLVDLKAWVEERRGEGKPWIRIFDCFTHRRKSMFSPWDWVYSEAEKDPEFIENL